MEIIPIVKQIKNAVQFSCPIQAPLQSSMAPAASIKDNIPVIANMLVIILSPYLILYTPVC
jgi:hypothetical protein